MLPCPPGNVLRNKCQCDRNDEFIVDCFENYTAVILRVRYIKWFFRLNCVFSCVHLQLGLWGYSVNGRLGYYQCPHGYCQCNEVNQNGNTLCSSVYYYNASNQQCNCDREGRFTVHVDCINAVKIDLSCYNSPLVTKVHKNCLTIQLAGSYHV